MTDDRLGKLKPEIKTRWIEALRCGDYGQTTAVLGRTVPEVEDGADVGKSYFCCLGVLCDLAAKDGVVESRLRAAGEHAYDGDFSTMPPPSVRDWAYEAPPERHFEWTVLADDPEEPGETAPLTALNDEDGLTFAQIADRIEASL